jgi:hypothetical protein
LLLRQNPVDNRYLNFRKIVASQSAAINFGTPVI